MEVTEILHVLQVANQFTMKAVEAQNSPVLGSKVNAMHHWSRWVTFPVLAAVLSNITVTTRSQIVRVLYAGNIQANKSAFVGPART